MNVGRGLYNVMTVGVAAIFFIAVMKLITAKYYIPGVSDIVAIV